MQPSARTPTFPSRLPRVGTTIFTVMSALAQQHGAVNLGQGFPDFGCDPALLDAVDAAMRAGHNQYPPMAGVPALQVPLPVTDGALPIGLQCIAPHGHEATLLALNLQGVTA